MRYEDASHTSAFQGSQPIANDDLDSLPAGSRTPATGNLISGEGTQTGSAGADIAAGAHVTAIAGKSGEDTSFAGGKLAVSGEHGKLSVDAEGNYVYQANAGVENVRDRFTYTLADNSGATDTGSLIVEIGKTPVVIKANAQQIVPGPDGVVTLPPGVELSDIRVVGRNLVIDMPDGTQLIIIDGAIFVPQLVLGGVEVPSTNLAALLVGQEPQPAAGEAPQSGGGNFDVPVPPLDPGVPLGDLIPPTEYDYQPPEPQDVEDILDEEPEVGLNPDVLMDDDVLQGGNAGGVGDDSPDLVNVSGQLSGSGGDGTLEFTVELTGAPSGFTYVSGGAGVVLIQQGGVTVITVTVDSDGSYTVVQNAAIDHAAGGDENNQLFTLNYFVTDDDGDSAFGTLTINVDDDTPVTTQASVGGTVDEDGVPGGIADGPDDVAGEVTVVNGSVAGLFSAGADTPLTFGLSSNTSGLPSLTSNGVAVTYQVVGDTLTASAGGNVVFTLTVNADGSYTFTLLDQLDHPTLNGQAGDNAENDLSIALGSIVQATDADGDTVTAPANGLVIVVDDDTPEPGEGSVTGQVDEDALPDGNNDSAAGDDPGGTTASGGAGSLAALFGGGGADQPLTFGLSGDTSGLPALTSNGVTVTYAVVGNVLTASAGGSTVFTLTVDADGSWEFELLDQLDHSVSGTEDNLLLDLSSIIEAEDADGDAVGAADGSFVIDVDDDIPVPGDGNVSGQVDEDALADGNNDSAAGDDPGGTTASGGAGSLAALFDGGADQPLTFGLSGDTSGLPALFSNGVAVDYQVVGNVLTASAGGSTVFTLTVNADGSWTFELEDQLDHPTSGTEDNLFIDFSSIIEAEDADGDPVTATEGSFVIDVDDDLPIADPEANVGGLVDEDDLPAGNNDVAAGDDNPGNADGDNDGTTTGGSAGSLAALFNAGADQPLQNFGLSTDTSGLPVLHSNGVLVTYAVVGDTLTASAGGSTVFTLTVNADGSWTFDLEGQLDHPTAGTEDNLSLDLSSIIEAEDADGDPATAADGTFVIVVDDDLPVADDEAFVGGLVDEDDLPAGNDDVAAGDDDPGNADGDNDGTTTGGSAGSLAALFNVGADQPMQSFGLLTDTSGLPVLHSNGVLVTYAVVGDTLTASAGGSTVFTLEVNPDGSWTFDLEGQLDHPTADTEDNLDLDFSSIITAEDADGDPATAADGTFVITVDDDLPVPAGEPFVGGLVDEDDLPTGNDDNAAGDDDPGNADGDNDGTTTGGGAPSLLTLFNIGADQPGTISLSTDTSGLPALTSNGVTVTYAVVGDTLTASAGGSTVFTLTVSADGSWEFDLEGQLDHQVDDTEDNLYLDLSSIIVAEDADGDTATAPEGSFVVTVDDDLPVAANDTDTVGAPGSTATGNVITDLAPGDSGDGDNGADSVGADQPGSITDLASNNEPGNSDTDPSANFSIQGEFGLLVMNADGNYTYTRDANTPGGGQDVFTYTLTDADGDSVTATLTITLADDRPVATTSAATVDDEGLGGGIAGGTGDLNANLGETTPSASEAIYNGTLGGTPGDGTTTFFFPASLDGDVVVIGQENVTLDVSPDGLTITGTGPRGLLFTIQITDAEAGDYTLTLNDNVLHETLNGLAGDDTENNATIILDYQMEDADGDLSLSPGQLTITFDDDIPQLSNVQPGSGVDLDETDAGSPGGFPINDTSAGAVISATAAFGADGAAAANSTVYGLAITGGPGSGLQTAIGNFAITLVAIDSDTIQGQYQDGGTQVAFTIQMNANGTVTLTQNVPLEHLVDGAPGAPHNDTLDLTGLINATITITDADGDSTSASAPIGDNLVFFDDGPDAQVDGQATLDQLVLDETRPIGEDGGPGEGDSDPAGLATVQANFANNFVSPVDYGGDGAGTTAYSLFLSANGIGSGLYALDNTDTETVIDGYGQGAEITLSINGAGTLITGSAGGTDYFTISINPATGVVTFTQLANVWHADTGDDDDTSSLMTDAASNIQVVQTVTDSDGDFDTASVNIGQGVFHIEDDGPDILEFTNAVGDNTGPTPTAEGIFDFDIGTDSPNGGNDDIFIDPTSVTLQVNGVDATNIVFNEGVENATTASYSFSFTYANGPGSTANATGTLVFDKAAGTYTVTLTSGPIEGFTTLETAAGTDFSGYTFNTSTPDNTQPDIAVTTILEESAPGANDGFYVQFTGFGAGNGSHETIGDGTTNTFTNGDLFSEGTGLDALHNSWVSVSGSANGVGGDQTNGPDALNFNLYSSDPTGLFSSQTGNTPTASASDMFLHFDTIGAGHDMVVVLKLWSDTNGNGTIDAVGDMFTTKAIVVQPDDIYKFGAAEEAGTVAALTGTQWEGVLNDIVALGGSNNNDGLVIIESSDYNGVGENWQIVGAQVVNAALGVTGDGINLNPDVGIGGDSDANDDGTLDAQNVSVITDTNPLKIMNIGFLAGTTTDQSLELSFDVTITDADGDSETTSLSATIGDPVSPALLPLSAESSESSTDTSSFSLLASDSQDQQLQKTAANSNTLTLAAAVAAVGVAETQVAAASLPDAAEHGQEAAYAASGNGLHVANGFAGGDSQSAVSNDLPEAANDAEPLNSSSHSSDPAESDHVLDDGAANADVQSSDAPAANDQGPASSSVEASPVAMAVGMPSAEALQAAGVGGNGEHGGGVEQILAEALGQGNATDAIDALLNALPGGNGGAEAIANLASQDAGFVPAWDMAMYGAIGAGHDMMFKMDVANFHHDAVQPVVNG